MFNPKRLSREEKIEQILKQQNSEDEYNSENEEEDKNEFAEDHTNENEFAEDHTNENDIPEDDTNENDIAEDHTNESHIAEDDTNENQEEEEIPQNNFNEEELISDAKYENQEIEEEEIVDSAELPTEYDTNENQEEEEMSENEYNEEQLIIDDEDIKIENQEIPKKIEIQETKKLIENLKIPETEGQDNHETDETNKIYEEENQQNEEIPENEEISIPALMVKNSIPSNHQATRQFIRQMQEQFDNLDNSEGIDQKYPEFDLLNQCFLYIGTKINNNERESNYENIVKLIQFAFSLLREIKYQKNVLNNNKWPTLKSNQSETEQNQSNDQNLSKRDTIIEVLLNIIQNPETKNFDEIKENACLCYLTIVEILYPKEMLDFFSDCISKLESGNESELVSFLFIIRNAIEDRFFNEDFPLFDKLLLSINVFQVEKYQDSNPLIVEHYLNLFNSIFEFMKKYVDKPKAISRLIQKLLNFKQKYRRLVYKIFSNFFQHFYDIATNLEIDGHKFYETLFSINLQEDLRSDDLLLKQSIIEFITSIAQTEMKLNQFEVKDIQSKNLIQRYSRQILQSFINIFTINSPFILERKQKEFDDFIEDTHSYDSLFKTTMKAVNICARTTRNLMPSIIDQFKKDIKSSQQPNQYRALNILLASLDFWNSKDVSADFNVILLCTDNQHYENAVVATAYRTLSKIIEQFPDIFISYIDKIVSNIRPSPIFDKYVSSILKTTKLLQLKNNQWKPNLELETQVIRPIYDFIIKGITIQNPTVNSDILFAYSSFLSFIDVIDDQSRLFEIFERMNALLNYEIRILNEYQLGDLWTKEKQNLCFKIIKVIESCLKKLSGIENIDTHRINDALENTAEMIPNLFGFGFDYALIYFFALYIKQTDTLILQNSPRLNLLIQTILMNFDYYSDDQMVISSTVFINNLVNVLISNEKLALISIENLITKYASNELIRIDNPILSKLDEKCPFLYFYQAILNQDTFSDSFPSIIASIGFIISLLGINSISICQFFIPIFNKFARYNYQSSNFDRSFLEALFEALCQAYLAICRTLLSMSLTERPDKTKIIIDITKQIARPVFILFGHINRFQLFDSNTDFYHFVILIIFHLTTVAPGRIDALTIHSEIQKIIQKAITLSNVDTGIKQIAKSLINSESHRRNNFFYPS